MQAATTSVPLSWSGVAGLALAAAVCLLGPLLLAYWWRRRTGVSWRAFAAGALVFFISQVVLRFPWQIPLARWTYGHPKWLIPFLLVSSFTAGLFEETGRWLGYRFLVREHSRRYGTMFGLGHGGLESILLAGFPLASLLVTWVLASHGSIGPGAALESVRLRTAGIGFWSVQLAPLERASAMALHVGLALIVLRAWTRRTAGWLVLAIGLHFGANALVALLIYARRVDPLAVELILLALAIGVLVTGWRLASDSARPAPAVLQAP